MKFFKIFSLVETERLDGIEFQLNLIKTVQKKIMATLAEEAAALVALNAQLRKATDEILAKIQALTDALAAAGTTSAEVDAATADLSAAAQKLDDIVPDAPTP